MLKGIPKSIPVEAWHKLLAAFREKPGNYRHAAIAAKIDQRTAKKGWLEGWPHFKRAPISQILQREAEENAQKAAIIKSETEAFAAALRGDARTEALDQYQRTARMVKAATITANNALSAVGKLNQVASDLAEMAPQLVAKIRDAVNRDELDPVQALIALEKISGFAHKVTATSNAATSQGAKAVEVERLMKGDATSIIGVKETLAEPVSAEEAKRLAAELAEAAQEAEAAASGQPDLKVLPGGAPEAQVG